MAILYTSAEVQAAQVRAQVAIYLISQDIENGFFYLYSPEYQNFKALQYDIYTLSNVVANENPFVTYSSTPTAYEYSFYELVGSMINKTKQFDVYGQFGGSVNPNYQAPQGGITVTTTVQSAIPPPITKNQSDLIFDSGTQQYYLPFLDNAGNPVSGGMQPATILVNGVSTSFTFDTTFSPPRIFGFASDAAQVIIITVI